MQNIEKILETVDLTAEDAKTKIAEAVKENYKPVADWQKQRDKVDSLTASLDEAKEALKGFEGVNVEELNKKIEELNAQIARNESEYEAKIADRDFNDLLKSAITEANGKNVKAITALLDVEALKSSQNQKDDMTKALKALAEAEDSKMLFGAPEAQPVATGSPIGTVKSSIRSSSTLDDIYKGNPYYHPAGQ